MVKSTGSWYIVRELQTGQLHRCRLRGKFKIKGLKASNPLAVGDHVEFTVEAQAEGAAVISHIGRGAITSCGSRCTKPATYTL